MTFLEIKDLHISIDGKQILTGLNLGLDKGEVHAIMGPNGSGKSTLANAIMGHPKYSIDSGDILVKGESILNLSTDLRARKGLFLGFQYPTEIPGVGYSHFLRNAYNTLNKSLGEEQNREVFITVREFHEYVKKNLDAVGLDPSFLSRYLNEGFSGGEKKRSEVMQMLVLKPNIAILDEPDSGLDIDSVKSVAEAINQLIDTGAGVLVITHYARILRYLKKLDHVHVVARGKVIKSGGKELSEELEAKGYTWLGIEEDK
ncbi:MAG: FeS assembly ATPase SufC [Nitrososphaera sp.]|jgi:Fe-S cluster assembly ATP-binding protein|nr:FeS assembly ATPase SufC [Nitrososphaera sp.]MCY1155241.1 FeS assembly ATPase SufC [Nitrososphaera sp.]MCY1156964.1 FeS assembly ATPase SufC [Nitrososphaera sp.]MDW0140263.1 Fe-S cluster assembly ATPase SufC [Nitrososphaeraceae archaeon]